MPWQKDWIGSGSDGTAKNYVSKKEYTGDFLNEHLKLENVEKEDRILFKEVIQRAKEYFANKESFEKNSNDAFYGND